MKLFTAMLCAVPLATAMSSRSLEAAPSCESLSALKLSNATITLAQPVAAGGFTRPATGPDSAAQAVGNLPAFCRVTATLMPSPDSDIKIEVWLPAAGWNGKFQAVGNGAWAGVRHDALPQSHTHSQPRAPRRTRGWWLVVRWMVCVLTSSTVGA